MPSAVIADQKVKSETGRCSGCAGGFSPDKQKPQQILSDLRGFLRSMAEKRQAYAVPEWFGFDEIKYNGGRYG